MKNLKLVIEKLNSKGAGLARHDGKIYFVPWALPGDEVEVSIEKEAETYGDAVLVKVLKESPYRQKPRCPVFFTCGGCDWQHLNYEQQLIQKKLMVSDSLKKLTKTEFEVNDVVPAKKNWNYRNRIQLHVSKKGQIGFYEAQSHDIVEFDDCFIAESELNAQLKELKSEGHKGPKSIELRSQSGQGFEQVHTDQNKLLKELVVNLVNPKVDDLIADVYCGAGNFTFELAKKAKKVIGFEKSLEALKVAQENTLKNKIDNIQWRQGEASRLLYQCVREKMKFDAMIFDPPRRGLDDVLKFIGQLAPGRVVLISCEIASFAKDVKGLLDLGYKLHQVTPLDMFPQTHHVEIVALLTKN